jgi:hypothetical protein
MLFSIAKIDKVVVVSKPGNRARIMVAIGLEDSLASAVGVALDPAVQLLP